MQNENNRQVVSGFPVVDENDLWLNYNPKATDFKLWSPEGEEVVVSIYAEGQGGTPLEEHAMNKGNNGTWTLSLAGDYHAKFYTFRIRKDGLWMNETAGPYAQAAGVNGKRGYVFDWNTSDPEGWSDYNLDPLESFQDIIVYELHIRDMSIHPSSGIQNRGKYLGLAETGTVSPDGLSTGIDHIGDLGVTHVHILPMFDYRSIDETKLEENKFNWGYDPANYNAPEGSYSTDPYDPEVRISEMKEMILAFHKKGIRVVMDVVYNHTGEVDNHSFNLSAPGYFYRVNSDGTLSDAAACGNETASEKEMMRKYMIESVLYWAQEYKIDGFRFDLMGIHDIETMNAISKAVQEFDPEIFIYGEGWKAGDSPMPLDKLALKANVPQLRRVAAFSDEVRDGIKGSWNKHKAPGFVSGNTERIEGVKFGIVGGVNHPQIDYLKINETDIPWAPQPSQCMVYVSCHDNHTLYDKLKIVSPKADEETILKQHVMANTIVLTSQGVPFLHAGVDFVRTKQGVENSFQSPDSINQIDWRRKEEYLEIHAFYQKLILLRKDHPIFKLPTREIIQENLSFLETDTKKSHLGYRIKGEGIEDQWNEVVVFFNAEDAAHELELPEGEWKLVLKGLDIDQNGLESISSYINIPSYTSIILVK